MEENNHSVVSKIAGKRLGCLQVFGLIVVAVIITAGVTILIFKTYFFPSEFKPVILNPHEEQVLTSKLEKLDSIEAEVNLHRKDILKKPSKKDRFDSSGALEPEPYSEKGIKREINFTEREVNALLAKNIDLVKEFGADKGFWKTFSDGVEDIKIEEGRLKIRLKE
jgi:hypothetical protein